MHNTTSSRLLAATLACALGACAKPVAPPPEPVVVSDVRETPGTLRADQAVTVTATVKAIDQKSRVVTLLTASGEEVIFKAGPEVRNLAQVKRGDHVQVTYYESVAAQVLKAGSAKPGITVASDADRAKLGERPGAAAAQSATIVATVVGVDKAKSTITLKGPEGNQRTIPVRNPAHLDAVRKGDLVEITYTEAVGVAVVPAP